MVICQTVTPGIRTQIADISTAHAMWAYLARRYCVSSQAQIFTLYQTLSGLQQGDESIDQFYSRFCELWRQVDALSPPECPIHAVAPTVSCTPCLRRSQHEETRCLYEFLMRLRPEFESCRAQLLHSPTAHTLDEAFALVLAEETRLRATSTGAGAALASQRFAPPTISGPLVSRPPATSTSSSAPRPKKPVTCYHCGILGHIERDCRKKQRGFPRVTAPAAPHLTASSPLLPTPSLQAHSVQPVPTPPADSPTIQEVMVLLRQLQHQIQDTSSDRASSAYSLPSASTSGTPCSPWLLDSGASLHITPDASLLTACCPPTHTTRVRIADGTPLLVSSIGHLSTSSFSVPEVSHVPRLSMSLMSVSQLTDYGCQVVFDSFSCRVQDRSGTVIRAGRRHSGVYMLDSLRLPSSSAPVTHCHAAVLPFYQWHYRLGHPCPSRLSFLVRSGRLGAVSPQFDVVCHGYKLGK